MYEYLIGGKKVIFNNPAERSKGLASADANNLSVEFVADNSADENLEVSTNPNEVTLENLQNGNFATDAAESAEVVSETIPAQDTESNLENGSSESTGFEAINYNNFLNQQKNQAKIKELISYKDEDLEAQNRDISGREKAKFKVNEEQFQIQLEKDNNAEKAYKEKNPAFNVKKTKAQIEAELRAAMKTEEALNATDIADKFLTKTNDKVFNEIISQTDLTGTTVSDLENSGDLVGEMRDFIKEELGIGFFSGGEGIATETIDKISRAAIQKAKSVDYLNIIKRQTETLTENNALPPAIFENRLNNNVNFIIDGLDPKEQSVVKAKQELLILQKNRPTAPYFGGLTATADFNKELFAYAKKVEEKKKVYAELNKNLRGEDAVMAFDAYTNERLTVSKQQAEEQGLTTVDLNKQYDFLASQIPGTYEGAKAAWYLNVNDSMILKESLQNKPEDFKITGYASWSSMLSSQKIPVEAMTLGSMVDARARGVDFEDVKVEGVLDNNELKKGDDLNKYLDNIVAKQKYLNLNQAVVNDLFLFNNDYSDPNEKTTLGGKATQFLKIMATGLVGESALDVSLNALGVQNFTTREKLDQAVRTLPELGFDLNEQQKENLDRTWGMEATEMIAGLGGAVVNFYVGNKILKGVKFLKVANKLAKGGYEYISIGDKAKALLSSSSTIAKGQGVLLTGLKEEALMQTSFLGEAPKGQGFGWGLGSLAGGKLGSLLPKFSGRFWGLGGIAQHAIGGATGGFAAHPVSMFTEAMYDSIANDKAFKTVMSESFIRDANGNDVHLLRDSFISAFGFTVFGFKDMKKSTVKNLFTSTKKVREVFNRTTNDITRKINEGITPQNYKEKLFGEELKGYEKLVDDHLTSKFNLTIIEGIKGDTVMSEMQYSAESAARYLEMSPEQRAKSTEFSSVEEANSVRTAFYDNLQSINTLVNTEFNNFKEGLRGTDTDGKDIKLNIVDNTKPQWQNTRGNYNPETGVLTINTSNLKSGVTRHEFNHILLSSLKGVEGAPIKLRNVIENEIDAALRKANQVFFINGIEYKSFGKYIDALHEKESEDYKANEYLSYLTQELKDTSTFKDALIDGGVLSKMKDGVTKFASLMGQSEKIGNFSFKNKDGVTKAPVSASEIVEFYNSFANGGSSVKANRAAVKGYERLLGNLAVTENGKTVNKHTGVEEVSLKEGVERTFDSKVIQAEVIEFKNKNLEKINKDYKTMLAENMDPETIGVSIGYKFEGIANKTMQSYLASKGLNLDSETQKDIVSDLMFEALPKAVKSYTDGQRFIEYIKENNLSKEDAFVEYKNRNIRDSSGTERFDRLYGMAQGTVKEASITSYILGNLTNQLIGVFKKPAYADIFRSVSLEVDKVDKLQQQGDLPAGEIASLDTSSPLLTPRRSRLTFQAKLNLSEKTINKVEETVDNIFAEQKLENLDAKTIGTVELGPAGKVKLVFPKEGNTARVEYSDGKKEILLGARSPKPIIEKILKKLKGDAFARLRKPGATEAEKEVAQTEFDAYSNLAANPPKLAKEKVFRDMLRSKVSKSIYEQLAKDAGEVGSLEYEAFVDRAFSLFQNNIAQRTVNKRFPEFKEPLLDSEGKQIRTKNAAGTPLYVKKNIVKAEWRKKFLEGPEQNINRTSLLEALSEELGFDRVFEMVMSEEGKIQIESGQEKLGVPLMEAYVAVIGKNIDRGVPNGGMDSKYIKEAAELLGLEKEAGERLYAEGMAMARDKKSYIEFDFEVAEMMETVATLDFNGKQGKSNTVKANKATVVSIGLGDPVKIVDSNGNKFASNGKNILAYTKKDFMELAPVFKELSIALTPLFSTLTTTKAGNVGKILGDLTGISIGKGFKGEAIINEKGEFVKTAKEGYANRRLFDEIINTDYKEPLLELSSDSKEIIATFESLLKQNIAYKGSLNVSKQNAKGDIVNSIIGNQNRLKAKQAEITEKGESAEKQIKEIDDFRNSDEGRAAILDIALGDALLESILAVSGDMYNNAVKEGNFNKAIKVANMLEIMLLNNTGTGIRSLSSMNLLHFGNEKLSNSRKNKWKKKNQNPNSFKNLGANEHILAKQKFGLKIMDLLRNQDLNDLAKIREVTMNFESLIGSEDKQMAGDMFGSRTGEFNRFTKALLAISSEREREPQRRIKKDRNFVTYAYGKIGGKNPSKNQQRINDIMNGAISKEGISNLKYTYDFVRGQTMYDTFIQTELLNSKNSFLVSKEAVAKNGKIINKIIASGVDVSTEFVKDPIGTEQQLLFTDKVSKSYNSKVNKERLEIENKKTGETRFETNKEYEKRLKNLEDTSPELFLPKALAEMIERKGGAKADAEISDSKAFMEGKKRKDDLFIPANADDFPGLLYKFYGKGKQGNKDMEFIKENILRPYTRAENALSTYRMNLVVDYKALEDQMKELGDNKAEVASVKRVEKLGYNIDQAVRVYIWSRLGKDIPGISEVEIAQLAGAVHNSPRLQAYAKGIMSITKTKEKYPDPSANWFRSNVQYDLFTYATDGIRSDFLAPWQANVDAMFTKENLNKLEARFGGKYVYNLKQILERMSKGKSRPESTNESFNKALNYVNGSVATIMFLNMRSAALQTISAANYVNWTDNNPIAIGKVIAEDPKLFFKTAQKIWNSDALKDRRTGLRINIEEAEMAKAINAGGRTNLQGLWDTMVKVGFKPTQMADSFAIVTGGTPFYMNRMKTYIKDGLSKSEAENKAFEDFLDLTQESQQSSQMDRVSNIQTGLMGRLVFSFNNTPFQMSRLQKKAALDLVNGRGDIKTNASKLAYYAFVQSTLFYGLQQGFYSSFMSDEDDNLTEKEKIAKYKDFEKRLDRIGTSTFQGILTGSGLPGKVAVTSYNTIREMVKQYDKGYAGKDFFPILNKALSISPTLGSKVSRMGRNWNSLMFSDFTKRGREVKNLYGPFDPQNPNNKAYLSMIGTVTNIPLDRIVQKMENIQNMLSENNENWEKVAMFFGAPKWSLQSAEENRSDMDDKLEKYYRENTPKRARDSTDVKGLTKAEQLSLIKALGVSGYKLKTLTNEEDRVEYILSAGEKRNLDLEKLVKDYTIPKIPKTDEYKELEKLTKSQQLKIIRDFGYNNYKIKTLNTEESRVNFILKQKKQLLDNKKKNSLK